MDFERLWQAYPESSSPCSDGSGAPNFENQCAIRVGLALVNGGIDTTTFHGAKCWYHRNLKHFLRGEELAAWMQLEPDIFGRVEIRRRATPDHYTGRKGIIFCRNFWGPGNQGDHIDLWDGERMKSGSVNYISRSDEVWFWTANR
jgi:hypothetical protein